MDGRRAVVGSVCFKHASDEIGRDQPAGFLCLPMRMMDDPVASQEDLDSKLQTRQARETGICPVREELFRQTFDEVIRQVTINCAERGLLLLRVRDEIRMRIAAYQTLYESCIAFGMRKALLSEQRKMEMEEAVNRLATENQDLERQVQELKELCEATEKKELERRTQVYKLDEKKHTDEVQSLTKSNAEFKKKLEDLLAPSQPVHKK
eukprot:768334-Hanusia_phi.AAC.6